MIGQPRLWSALEVTTDHALGSLLATPVRMILAPFVGLHLSSGQHVELSALLFVMSLVRSFGSRRVFNWLNLRRSAA